jgi:hypothetical protein
MPLANDVKDLYDAVNTCICDSSNRQKYLDTIRRLAKSAKINWNPIAGKESQKRTASQAVEPREESEESAESFGKESDEEDFTPGPSKKKKKSASKPKPAKSAQSLMKKRREELHSYKGKQLEKYLEGKIPSKSTKDNTETEFKTFDTGRSALQTYLNATVQLHKQQYNILVYRMYKLYLKEGMEHAKTNTNFITEIKKIDKTFSQRKFYTIKNVVPLMEKYKKLQTLNISLEDWEILSPNLKDLFQKGGKEVEARWSSV